MSSINTEESESILSKFQQLLRIPTVSGTGPDGAYDDCATWLLSEMKLISGCECSILPSSLPGKPIVVGSIEGLDPSLPAIYLNAHYDVVPVIESDWTFEAFCAERLNGKVYGRGSQDMKCVIIGYLCALQRMSAQGLLPTKRTILLSFVPDEEIGGADGMCILLESAWFEQYAIRNSSTSATSVGAKEYDGIAIAFDEGLASTDNDFSVFYGERLPWWIKIAAEGNTGHGSRFIEHTAVNALMHVVNCAMLYRESQRCKIHTHRRTLADGTVVEEGCTHARIASTGSSSATLGDVTSLNVTLLRAGLTVGSRDVLNVIPATAEAGFDIRISPHDDPAIITTMLDTWVQQANALLSSDSNTPLSEKEKGKGVTRDGNKMGIRWYYENLCGQQHAITNLDDGNKWWTLFRSTMSDADGINSKCRTEVFPAATDSRFLRALGIKALGFSPMRNTKIMLHENDEYLEETCILEGVDIYVQLFGVLANADSSYDA